MLSEEKTNMFDDAKVGSNEPISPFYPFTCAKICLCVRSLIVCCIGFKILSERTVNCVLISNTRCLLEKCALKEGWGDDESLMVGNLESRCYKKHTD